MDSLQYSQHSPDEITRRSEKLNRELDWFKKNGYPNASIYWGIIPVTRNQSSDSYLGNGRAFKSLNALPVDQRKYLKEYIRPETLMSLTATAFSILLMLNQAATNGLSPKELIIGGNRQSSNCNKLELKRGLITKIAGRYYLSEKGQEEVDSHFTFLNNYVEWTRME